MGRAPHHGGRESATDRAIAADALDAVGGARLADRLFSSLSSGERQRVQLARVLAQIWAPADVTDPGPRFLLLDEPTSNLDLAHQHAALTLVRSVSRRAVGALVVLHDLNLAAEYADRIALLREGELVTLGEPVEVLRADLLERVFDIPVMVVPHPRLSRPLVVPDPEGRRATLS
jgi:iron complex transport system ATP-binding protein